MQISCENYYFWFIENLKKKTVTMLTQRVSEDTQVHRGASVLKASAGGKPAGGKLLLADDFDDRHPFVSLE